MPAPEYTDLYEIIIHVDLEGVRARREKYKTKRTATNFLPQRLTDEEEKQGYSHRMGQRVPVKELMQIQAIGFGDGSDHVHRHGYCLADQQHQMFNMLRADIEAKLIRMRDNAIRLVALWQADDTKLKTKPCRS